jgi:hypothetical protein
MKKYSVLVLAVVLIPSFALSATSNFSLKVGGGLGYSIIGEINDILRDYPVFIRTYRRNVSDDLAPVHFGPNFVLEAVYSLNPSFSLGLAVGYGSAQNQGSIHLEYGYESQPIIVDETYTPKVRFIPFTLSGYYTMALNQKWSVILGAGLGYNWATFIFEIDTRSEAAWGVSTMDSVFRAGRGALGVQASAAIEMNISPLLSVFVSGSFRLALASGFIGELEFNWNDYGVTGSITHENRTFWVYTFNHSGTGYTEYAFRDTTPSGAQFYSNVHKGKINIGGAILGIGARIRL